MATLKQKIVPHLWYDTQAKEAAQFYCSDFPDSKVTNVTTIHDTPSGDCDVVTFELMGQSFQAISAGPLFKFNESISFMAVFTGSPTAFEQYQRENPDPEMRKASALHHLPGRRRGDHGFSTSAEGELGIDLLYAAASRSFDDYRKHIVERELEGVPVKILDVDGMLMSKPTERPEDIPDLQRLLRLKGPGRSEKVITAARRRRTPRGR